MKKIAKRGLALLLMLVMCLPLGLESASAADDTPLAGVDGVVDIWKWTKVKAQADLPDGKATRTVGGKTETYDYALLITYEYKGQKYFLDLGAENRKPFRGADVKDAFWMPATPIPGGVDISLDTFRTKGNIGHMTLRATGKKDSDNKCKIYHIYDESGSDQLYMVGGNFPDAFDVGLCFYSSSYISGIYSGVLANGLPDWSICTHDAQSSHVSDGKTKIFMNLSDSYDGCLDIDSKNGGSKISSPGSWDFQAFDVYVGVKEQWSAIRSDYTIKSGMVANYNGYIYVEPNVTITVEAGGVLSSSGVLYNNGTIICNAGGTVLVQPDASIEQFCLGDSPGGYLYCMGGDLVILSGGRVTTNMFYLRNGGTCTNFGVLVLSGRSSTIDDGATLDNRASGTVFLGFEPLSSYAGNLSALSRSRVKERDVYKIKLNTSGSVLPSLSTLTVGSDVMLYNEGTIISTVRMIRDDYYSGNTGALITAKNIACKGSGRIRVYESCKNLNDKLGYTSCLSEWSSMYSLYEGQ